MTEPTDRADTDGPAATPAGPSSAAILGLSAAVGLGSGLLEVGLRSDPRLGYSPQEVGLWLFFGAASSLLFAVAVAAILVAVGRRPLGLLLGGVALLHAALVWRFDLYLNERLTEPVVLGGLAGVALLCLGGGALIDPALQRLARARPWALPAVCALLGGLGLGLSFFRQAAPHAPARDADHPSVLLITLDTTRPDHIGAYGSLNDTPNIDRLARQGTLFTEAVATAPLTEPSHLAILTGIPPYRSGVLSNGTPLGERPALLSHSLSAAGWTTAAFVSAFPLHDRYGWSQGFDVYDDDFGDIAGLHRLSIVKAWDQVFEPAHALRERRGDLTLTRARQWLSEHHEERFFLWVHLFDPHGPYAAPGYVTEAPRGGDPIPLPAYWPAEYQGISSTPWFIDAYQAEIRWTDRLVGQLLGDLQEGGALDETVVVLTADHGESLTEHDYFFDHGDQLYDPSLLVPLLVRYPPLVQAGSRMKCPVSNMDITPTLLDLLDLPAGPPRDGQSLKVALSGGPCVETPVLATTVAGRYTESPPIDRALRASRQKIIRRGKSGEPDVCFDLARDPFELAPLAACPPGLGDQLGALLHGAGEAVAPAGDAATEQQLKALGYVE